MKPTESEIAVEVAYYMLTLRPRREDYPVLDASVMIKKMLPKDWSDLLIACTNPTVQEFYTNSGVERAAVVAAMFIPQSCQDALRACY